MGYTLCGKVDTLEQLEELKGDSNIYIQDNIPKFYDDNTKTVLRLGNLSINITKQLNWFQKKMWKICFGIIVEDI